MGALRVGDACWACLSSGAGSPSSQAQPTLAALSLVCRAASDHFSSYEMDVYTPAGERRTDVVADLCKTAPAFRRGKQCIGHLINEANRPGEINVEYYANLTEIYKHKSKLEPGDKMFYQILNTRPIKAGEPLLSHYGNTYRRSYKTNLIHSNRQQLRLK